MSSQIELNMVNGVPFPSFIDQKTMDDLNNFSLHPGDLFVVTYPKSGTTWTQQIVKLIQRGGIDDSIQLNKTIPWLEEIGRDSALVRLQFSDNEC